MDENKDDFSAYCLALEDFQTEVVWMIILAEWKLS